MTRMLSLVLALGLSVPAIAETTASSDENTTTTQTASEEVKPSVVAPAASFTPVSYTHLTLPTKRIV